MPKIVINKCYGGFSLSDKAMEKYQELSGCKPDIYYYDIARTDPYLVQTVEELGAEANTKVSKLKVVEVPDEIDWELQEYDGIEWIAEKHRTWE